MDYYNASLAHEVERERRRIRRERRTWGNMGRLNPTRNFIKASIPGALLIILVCLCALAVPPGG